MRIMAIDYGDQRTGLAVSDLLGMLCGEAWTVTEWNPERLAEQISREAKSREVGTLVLGLPRNMDGSAVPPADPRSHVTTVLEDVGGLPVGRGEARRSSSEAHAILHAAGKKEKKHRKTVDAVAASLILEGYLGSLR